MWAPCSTCKPFLQLHSTWDEIKFRSEWTQIKLFACKTGLRTASSNLWYQAVFFYISNLKLKRFTLGNRLITLNGEEMLLQFFASDLQTYLHFSFITFMPPTLDISSICLQHNLRQFEFFFSSASLPQCMVYVKKKKKIVVFFFNSTKRSFGCLF